MLNLISHLTSAQSASQAPRHLHYKELSHRPCCPSHGLHSRTKTWSKALTTRSYLQVCQHRAKTITILQSYSSDHKGLKKNMQRLHRPKRISQLRGSKRNQSQDQTLTFRFHHVPKCKIIKRWHLVAVLTYHRQSIFHWIFCQNFQDTHAKTILTWRVDQIARREVIVFQLYSNRFLFSLKTFTYFSIILSFIRKN